MLLTRCLVRKKRFVYFIRMVLGIGGDIFAASTTQAVPVTEL